jgi:hypothetical protein
MSCGRSTPVMGDGPRTSLKGNGAMEGGQPNRIVSVTVDCMYSLSVLTWKPTFSSEEAIESKPCLPPAANKSCDP